MLSVLRPFSIFASLHIILYPFENSSSKPCLHCSSSLNRIDQKLIFCSLFFQNLFPFMFMLRSVANFCSCHPYILVPLFFFCWGCPRIHEPRHIVFPPSREAPTTKAGEKTSPVMSFIQTMLDGQGVGASALEHDTQRALFAVGS